MSKVYVFLLVLSFLTWVPAAVVLNEQFDNDNGNWISLLSGTDSIYDGKMHLVSTGSTAINWVVNSSVNLKDFTLSVETEMFNPDSNARVGITFRTKDSYESYQFYIYPSGHYFVVRYNGLDYFDFSDKKLIASTFISSSKNSLKVIGKGNVFSFLCNGQLLTTITDDSLPNAGVFGLMVTGKLTATFDNLVIDDEAIPDSGLKSFQDDFSSIALTGWANYAGIGSFTVNNGKLNCVASTTGSFSTLVSEGNYGNADTISVTTEKVLPLPGNQNVYGVMFHYSLESVRDTLRNRGYIFSIINDGNTYGYALIRLSDALGTDASYTLLFKTSIKAQSTTLKLKVINFADGKKVLYLNDEKIDSLTDNAFPSGGVGLVGLGGVKVNFDDFKVSSKIEENAVEASAMLPSINSLVLNAIPNPFSSSTKFTLNGIPGSAFKLTLFDVNGNRLEKHEGRLPCLLSWDATTLTPGIYFARLATGSQTITQKLVLLR